MIGVAAVMMMVVVVVVVQLLASASGASAQGRVVFAPGPPPPPLGIVGTPLFNSCSGKTGRQLFECHKNEFEPYISARNKQASSCTEGGAYKAGNAPCPTCPTDPQCSAFGGLCIPRLTPEGVRTGNEPVSPVVDDCPEETHCVRHTGTDRCTSRSPGGDCTCKEVGGELISLSRCNEQCGVYAKHRETTPQTTSPNVTPSPGEIGMPVPNVCCLPAGSCDKFHTHSCFDGSACYRGQCDGAGRFSCPSGLGSEVQNEGHPVCGPN